VAGLLFPLVAGVNAYVRPWLLRREVMHWMAAIDTQAMDVIRELDRDGVSESSWAQLRIHVYQQPPDRWSPALFDLLVDRGLIGLDFTPLPERIAWSAAQRPESRETLAQNPSVAPEILSRIARGIDFSASHDCPLTRNLLWNPALSEADVEFIRGHLVVALESGDVYLSNVAQENLTLVRRRRESPRSMWSTEEPHPAANETRQPR
jgi:hypothetical protein